jgi:hypothetical protein
MACRWDSVAGERISRWHRSQESRRIYVAKGGNLHKLYRIIITGADKTVSAILVLSNESMPTSA